MVFPNFSRDFPCSYRGEGGKTERSEKGALDCRSYARPSVGVTEPYSGKSNGALRSRGQRREEALALRVEG
ncbi:hypothetical protein AKJ65_04405 [candidate division MSBL1 archaeon SCGC-AAA259E19]|uniref:Uncharacterized protein n=1 Tax=candidate division MSBL1 archaeon SCGC-AAA259E19 TaxID=1698264 RepID=A0A133UJR4_9EURY|nr:hypothetical protein AKJ65_04405 [candidate division MSBL1 archaeon SCGC-AAA259E19]